MPSRMCFLESPRAFGSSGFIGEKTFEIWSDAATNLPQTAAYYEEQLRALGHRVFGFASGMLIGILQFVLSTIIAESLAREGKHSAARDAYLALYLRRPKTPLFALSDFVRADDSDLEARNGRVTPDDHGRWGPARRNRTPPRTRAGTRTKKAPDIVGGLDGIGKSFRSSDRSP